MKKRLASIVKAPIGLLSRPGGVISKKISQATGSVSFLESLRNVDIRKKLIFTIGILVVYRILNAVPLPGIDVRLFIEVFRDSPLTNIFTLVTGGRLDNPSLVSIGLGAYINASIVIQLLQTVIPKFEELSKEGERGRKTLNQYTRILAVPLSAIQGFVIYTILSNVGTTVPELAGLVDGITPFQVVTMIVSLTAGSILLMWLGELISERGIGNGISILITVSILSSLPGLIARDFSFMAQDLQLLAGGNFNVLLNENFLIVYAVIIGLILLVLGVVYINEAVRKITIQYARRFRGDGMQGSYLPLKINQAGVIPVIFASALLTFPQIISQFLLSSADSESFLFKLGAGINDSFLGADLSTQTTEERLSYFAAYALLIIGFTFFYTFVTYKPSETADNLKKSGGFIPGLRPGKATQKFITHVLVRLTVVGSIFLAVISLIPSIVILSPQGANLTIIGAVGGTSILIIVGVILDTIRQMKSLTVSISYDQYK
ncbi:MAG: Protein translocase subunit SecY [candidate division WS6 bacterium OLB20]|uniref:Protein translocase subunit SecY n=1 Tax=candidate division WS6 bacterium OLB20 TaxID=1617426 RepID=A0A136LX25_9BACT|nr:MAG: Protein translocase subunit SecY [candidate division WS6 bacterium OLB20]